MMVLMWILVWQSGYASEFVPGLEVRQGKRLRVLPRFLLLEKHALPPLLAQVAAAGAQQNRGYDVSLRQNHQQHNEILPLPLSQHAQRQGWVFGLRELHPQVLWAFLPQVHREPQSDQL